MQEMWVWSLGWKDPFEWELGTYSNIPAWRIPWIEEPGGLQSMGSQRLKHSWAFMHAHKSHFIECQNWDYVLHHCVMYEHEIHFHWRVKKEGKIKHFWISETKKIWEFSNSKLFIIYKIIIIIVICGFKIHMK